MSRQALISSSYKYPQQDPQYRGEQVDKMYRNGPMQHRSCTDVFCCLIFLVFIGGMIYIAYVGYSTGNPSLLAAPFDEQGNQCGLDPGFQPYQKIFISQHLTTSQLTFICVTECPPSSNSTLLCHPNSIIPSCSQLLIYSSKTTVNICLPTQPIKLQFDINQFIDLGFLQQSFSDIKCCRYVILAMFGMSLIISLLYSVLVRYWAGCCLWTMLFMLLVVQLLVGTITFLLPLVPGLRKATGYDDLPENLKNRDYQITIVVISWLMALLTLVVMICFRKQIIIAIAILKASAEFVRECCGAFFIPFIVTALQILFVGFWLVTMLYLFSSGQKVAPIENTPFGWVQWDDRIRMYTIYYLFGLIWIVAFLEGMGVFWVSSAAATWYFERDAASPVCKGITRSFLAMGSIAFGSFILAVVTFIKLVLELINQQFKQKTLAMNQGSAAAMQCVIKCASCCISCFERVIRFLTENAYIMMAISGKNFCSSAQEGFYLILRCSGQIIISHGATKLFVGLGRTLIVTVTATWGYLIVTGVEPYKSQIYEPWILTLVFVIVSFPVATAFLSFYQMAADTILMCYCVEIDLKIEDSNCPNGLRKFLSEVSSSVASDQ